MGCHDHIQWIKDRCDALIKSKRLLQDARRAKKRADQITRYQQMTPSDETVNRIASQGFVPAQALWALIQYKMAQLATSFDLKVACSIKYAQKEDFDRKVREIVNAMTLDPLFPDHSKTAACP